jgi:hypothetical protein
MSEQPATNGARFRLTIRRRVAGVDDLPARIAATATQLRAAGVRGYALSRIADDPSETELSLHFATLEQAEAMARQLDLPESRERALLAGAMELGSMWVSETVVTSSLD